MNGGRSPVTELLWRAWTRLGVEGWNPSPLEGVIDPEVLIVATNLVHDDRLVEATVDWARFNRSLLMGRRLLRIAGSVGATERMEAWLEAVDEVSPADELPLRQRAGRFDPSASEALGLRWRAVAGTNVRSDLIRLLHPVLVGFEGPLAGSVIVERAAVARSHTNDALDALVDAGIVARSGTQRRRAYAPIATGDPTAEAWWSPWREIGHAPWGRLAELVSFLTDISAEDDGYDASVRRAARFQQCIEAWPELGVQLLPSVVGVVGIRERGRAIRSASVLAQEIAVGWFEQPATA